MKLSMTYRVRTRGFNHLFDETVRLYRQAVSFFVDVCLTEWNLISTGNFMPELIVDIYNKYVAGDLKGSLAAQYKLNPVRLAMDGASFPVAAKDMAIMRGQAAGKPYLPNLPTPEGASYDKMKKEMEKAGLI